MGTNGREQSGESKTVAAQIRAERAASDLTQLEVYTRAGIRRSTYLRIEAGSHVADTTEVARITRALGITMSEFFRRVENRKSSR